MGYAFEPCVRQGDTISDRGRPEALAPQQRFQHRALALADPQSQSFGYSAKRHTLPVCLHFHQDVLGRNEFDQCKGPRSCDVRI